MARVAKTTTKDIESLEHREARRKNIPTAELETLVSEGEQAPKTIRYIAEIRYGHRAAGCSRSIPQASRSVARQ